MCSSEARSWWPSQVASPARNVCGLEALLLQQHHVSFGWCPYAQSVICMVNEMSLSFLRMCGSCQEGVRESNCCEHSRALNVRKFRQDLFPDYA